MSEQIFAILKRKLEDLSAYGEVGPETKRNVLKEELQFFVLNFIYHHPEYGKWIMYGGSALRIIHGLDRMSVDLDFEVSHEITKEFLEKLEKEIEKYFIDVYGAGTEFLSVKINPRRGLLLKFNVGEGLSIGLPSNQVNVEIDLNYFTTPKIVTERRPINHGQLSFVITTYNLSALMASKIAAIFLREQRGINKNFYDYKGRDIYDLLWYMNKKALPDFDYLNAKLKTKGAEAQDIKTLFNKLTINILNYEKMDELLKEDLKYLFENQSRFKNWFDNWRESYLRLLDDYKISGIKTLQEVEIFEDLLKDIIWFTYTYETEDEKNVRIRYAIEDLIIYDVGNLNVAANENVIKITIFRSNGTSTMPAPRNILNQYAALFYKKTEAYFKKTNRIMLGDNIITKVIRMTADNLNQKEEILLNKSALLSCELDDLLK